MKVTKVRLCYTGEKLTSYKKQYKEQEAGLLPQFNLQVKQGYLSSMSRPHTFAMEV